ncbi:MAG: hypothetical protein ABI199_03915 [Bacteroidia bacterium]
MKKITTLVLFSFLFCVSAFAKDVKMVAATDSSEESNCYIKWAKIFEMRGADTVGDGWHNDVIITFRTGSSAECFDGKALVKDGAVVEMDLRLVDGTYEQVKKKLRYNYPLTVINGMSKTTITVNDELINVLFIKKIKAKKKPYAEAPEPSGY